MGYCQKSLPNAKVYFNTQLIGDDYYNSNALVRGIWMGKGCKLLGLEQESMVHRSDFISLCRNLNPFTGERLTARQNKEGKRRIYFDFVGSAPKTISIMACIMMDKGLQRAHEEAANVAFQELERFADVRRGKRGKASTYVRSSNIIAAVFQHNTSRANDPQVHTHYIVFNATYDEDQQRWKALSAFSQHKALAYLTAIYRRHLKKLVQELGYEVTAPGTFPDDLTRFEIKGVPADVMQLYSQRTEQLENAIAAWKERRAAKNLPEREPTKKEQKNMVRATRPRKKDMPPAELEATQASRLTPEKRVILERVLERAMQRSGRDKEGKREAVLAPSVADDKATPPTSLAPTMPLWTEADKAMARRVLKQVIAHEFERRSVVFEGELLCEAMRWSSGLVNIGALQEVMRSSDDLILSQGRVTTREVVAKEIQLEYLVRAGLGKFTPICRGEVKLRGLNEEQHQAAEFALKSTDAVVGLRGLAGSGKSRTIIAMVNSIPHDRVFSCAPTVEATAVLRGGIKGRVETMQRFLKNPTLHHTVKNGVIILDEAGLVGLDDMIKMLTIAREQNAKLILSGDSRQHSSVTRGDALRQLEKGRYYRCKEIPRILRQKDAEYRDAVSLAAEMKPDEAMEKIESLGWISESYFAHEMAVDAYMNALANGKDILMVAPGKGDRDIVTKMLRNRFREEGRLGDDVSMSVFTSLGWTEAEKKNARHYTRGKLIYFPVSTGAFHAHERVSVIASAGGVIYVKRASGPPVQFRPELLHDFDVGEETILPLAPGDRIMLKENRGATIPASKISNGQSVTVKSIDKATKRITLEDGRVLPANYCKYQYAYASTSSSAQGKTATDVIVAVTRRSGKAANMKQFYVSVSRGEQSCQIFTDDQEWLKERNQDKAERQFGFELLNELELEELRKATEIAITNTSQGKMNEFLRARRKRLSQTALEEAPAEIPDTPDIDL